ncbi:MAG: ferrous iron transport protein A [Candidatus Margulisbacteria bacterium]|jgi:Mn-dependent DtxR family transcriptional regulator/Fe2+ transport system protein FeoA|nr:ferrous iron transport protein A [Candidatus Margulisiibacteriota bacterium]
MADAEETIVLAEMADKYGGRRQALKKVKEHYTKDTLNRLAAQNYAQAGSAYFALTEQGLAAGRQAKRAVSVLRIFCAEILGLTQKETAGHLQTLLGGITPALLERYCTLIGHAYSHKIPEGACCAQAKAHNAETVLPLNQLPVGVDALVIYVQTSQRPELLKLYDLGIHPGKTVRLQQLYPAYIIATEQGRLALDNTLTGFIFVQRT